MTGTGSLALMSDHSLAVSWNDCGLEFYELQTQSQSIRRNSATLGQSRKDCRWLKWDLRYVSCLFLFCLSHYHLLCTSLRQRDEETSKSLLSVLLGHAITTLQYIWKCNVMRDSLRRAVVWQWSVREPGGGQEALWYLLFSNLRPPVGPSPLDSPWGDINSHPLCTFKEEVFSNLSTLLILSGCHTGILY